MVDLAKIRKKVKSKLTGGESTSLQVDESSSGPAAPSGSSAVLPLDSDSKSRREDSPAASSKLDRFKREAGTRRETLRVADVAQLPQSTLELLTFLIAGEQYAVEIERIVEIVPPRPVTRIPNSDDTVVGIISLRGTIVTLVDVRGKLRHPPGLTDHNTRIIVIDFQNETVGFSVDRVSRVVKLPASEVEPHPVVHATELEDAIRGVFRSSGALTILLDLDKLLDSHAVRLDPWT